MKRHRRLALAAAVLPPHATQHDSKHGPDDCGSDPDVEGRLAGGRLARYEVAGRWSIGRGTNSRGGVCADNSF